MQVVVNGAQHEIDSGTNLAQLLEQLTVNGKGRIAIEINGEIVPRSSFKVHKLQSGDAIEIVQAIGGG